jgi:hypothetical protein
MDRIKKYCFILCLLLLFAPIAQRFFTFVEEEPLEGLAAMPDFPTFKYKQWMNGEYQKLAEKFIIDNFGFRNTLLRTINTLDYRIFRTSNSKQVIVGKDGHLFFSYNIERYLGIIREEKHKVDSLFDVTNDFVGKLKDKKGVEFIFVIAPSNGFYYKDKFPKQYDRFDKRTNDYDMFLENLEKHNINYIDFNQWFLDIRDTVSYPLFPKHGTHYSYFSSVWVADSLLSYMEHLKKEKYPEIIYKEINEEPMRVSEHDLENLMNLSHNLENENMPYYKLSYNYENRKRPKVLTVGDSFYWNVLNNLIPLNAFANVTFWFYNQTVYPESFTRALTPEEINLDVLYKDLDFIVIFASSTLLYHYDFDGFLERQNSYLDGELIFFNPAYVERLNFYIDAINASTDWYNDTKAKARSNNVKIDDQIRAEAEWMVWKEGIPKHVQ